MEKAATAAKQVAESIPAKQAGLQSALDSAAGTVKVMADSTTSSIQETVSSAMPAVASFMDTTFNSVTSSGIQEAIEGASAGFQETAGGLQEAFTSQLDAFVTIPEDVSTEP